MSNTIDDKELDEYLSGSTAYSRRYRAIEVDAVPEDLDRLVLAQTSAVNVVPIGAANTHATVANRSKSLGTWKRLSAPIALAASLVLVMSIVLRSGVRYDTPVMNESARTAPAVSLPDKSTIESATKMPAREPISAKTDVIPEAMPEAKVLGNLDALASQDKRKIVAQPSRVDNVAPTRELQRDAALQTRAKKDEAAISEVRAMPPSSPAPAAERPVAYASKANLAKTVDSPANAPVPSSARAQTSLEEIVVTGSLVRGTANRGAGPRGTIPPTSFAEREPSDAEITKQQRETDPRAWLEYIRELRTSGKSRDANSEWKRFAKAYPNYFVDASDAARAK